MSIAFQITEGSNAINIYDKEFDSNINYQIRLTDKDFCSPAVVVDVDGISFCKDNAKLSFTLPCLDVSQYKLEVVDSDTSDIIYTFNSIYYS